MLRVCALLLTWAAFAAAQSTCKIGELPQSGSVQGTFVSADCPAARYLPDVPDPGRAQGWILTATARSSVYTFRLTSTQTPARLYVNDGSTTLGGSETRSADGAAEVTVQLPPGQYLVVAVLGTNTLGSYQLSSESRPPKQCDAAPIEPGTDVTGTLDPGGCTQTELLQSVPDSSPASVYRLMVPKAAIATVTLTTTDFAGRLTLFNAAGGSVQAQSAVSISVDPGTYRIVAGTQDGKTGAYTIRVDLDDRRECPVSAIPADGSKVSGELKPTGCRVMDAFPAQTDDRPIDRYEFELTSKSLVSAAQTSTAFDTELYLLDAKGNVVASNDDASVATTDSLLGTSLAPGKYSLVASTHDGTAGTYNVSVSTQAARACSPGVLSLPGSATASLNTNGCRYLDAVQPATDTYPAAVFRMTVPKTSFVTLTSTSPSFATAVELHAATGELLSSTTLSSQVAQLVPEGEYQVIVLSANASGNAGVTATVRAPAACASTALTADGIPVAASLTASGCALRELIPGPAPTTPSNLYSLEIDRPGNVHLAVETTAFVSSLMLLTPEGKIAASGLVELDAQVQPGRYQVVVTTVSPTGGDYRISATRPDAGGTAAVIESVPFRP